MFPSQEQIRHESIELFVGLLIVSVVIFILGLVTFFSFNESKTNENYAIFSLSISIFIGIPLILNSIVRLCLLIFKK